MSTVLSKSTFKSMTAEEFGQRPQPADGSREELVRGEIETMPPPKPRHGYVQVNTACLLKNFVQPRNLGWVISESGVILDRDPDTVRGPDIFYFSKKRLPKLPEDYVELPPDLAVEVLSPDDRPGKVRDKITQYLATGVKLVWLVDPQSRTVTVYAGNLRGKKLIESDTIDGGKAIPGFTATVAEFFI